LQNPAGNHARITSSIQDVASSFAIPKFRWTTKLYITSHLHETSVLIYNLIFTAIALILKSSEAKKNVSGHEGETNLAEGYSPLCGGKTLHHSFIILSLPYLTDPHLLNSLSLQLLFSILTFALVAEYSGYSKVDFTVSNCLKIFRSSSEALLSLNYYPFKIPDIHFNECPVHNFTFCSFSLVSPQCLYALPSSVSTLLTWMIALLFPWLNSSSTSCGGFSGCPPLQC